MNKKKLPKAIMRPAGEAAAQPVRAPDNVIEMVPKEAAAKPDAAAPPAARFADDAEVAKRRRQARKIVQRHANLSAVGGAIPLPVVNIASVTGILVHMVRALCRLHGVPFEDNRARTVVIALMGGSMPTGLAAATASTLMYVVPGTNMLGLAVSSVTASATARSIGQMLTQHLERGATLADFPALRVR